METTQNTNHGVNNGRNGGGDGYGDVTSHAIGGIGNGDSGLSEIYCGDIEGIGNCCDTRRSGPKGSCGDLRKGFKKKERNRLEFEHEHFQEGKLHQLKNIKRKKQQSEVINKPCVHINELKATLAKVRDDHKQLSNRIRRFKYDMEQTLLEVQTTTEAMINKLLSTFSKTIGRKRTFIDVDEMINFIDIERDFESISDRFKELGSDVDCLMTLSALRDKAIIGYGGRRAEGGRRGGGNGCCIPKFLHDLYDMVEKEELNDLISWALPRCDSFIIRDINKFANDVLPMYFKHKNFGSFNSQLNIYDFKKVSWEKHEYANEWFRGGKYDLLANIMKRNKNVRLIGFGVTLSTTEVETFNNQLKTIQHDQQHKIIWLSNFEEQIKSSVHECKEMVNNMANVVDKMIEKSCEKHEIHKKVKLELEKNVIGDGNTHELEVNELEIAPRENENPDVQFYIQDFGIGELRFEPEELIQIMMEWKAHALNDTSSIQWVPNESFDRVYEDCYFYSIDKDFMF